MNCSAHTLEKTNLGALGVEDLVNLEPALKGDVGNSGHVVQGHVDGTAQILVLNYAR